MGKDLQALNAQNKLALWAGRISECCNSGQSVKAWYRENRVCEQTYYKWQRKLFEIVMEQQEVQFAEVTPVQSACSGTVAITIRLAGVEAALLLDLGYGIDLPLPHLVGCEILTPFA